MFDFVRKHTKIMQFTLFVLIVPSFALVGLEGYNSMQEKGAAVAKVDGKEIRQPEWDEAHKREVDRIRQQVPNIDMKLLDSPAARYGTLERLVRDRVIAAAAENSKLAASDQRLARELQSNQMIAALRGPDGKLDMGKYRALVGQQGMSPEMFEESVRADLTARQVMQAVGGSSFTPAAQAAPSLGAFFEKREIQVAPFAAAEYKARVTLTDADLEAFYKANMPLFQAPEQASIEYVLLDLETVKKGITLAEADLKSYYEQNVGRIVGQEERRASHILITSPKGAAAPEREKAKARAQELLAQVRKNPDSFAEVAKKNSQDSANAGNGGDLDFFPRGAMTKPFEDAVFAMKKGDVSDVVETDFGFHIIRLTDVKTPKQKTFEEVRPELEAQLKTQQAQKKYAEVADTFSNGVYEQADSLKPIADKLKLEVQSMANVQRTSIAGAKGPLANPKLLAAIFAPDSIEKKRNTEAVEVGPSMLISARVTQYQAARTLPFAEVKERVRDRMVASKAAELAKKEGAEKLAAWKAAPATAQLPAPIVVSRQEGPQQPAPVIEAALRADPAALPAWAGVDLGEQGYAVVKVTKVVPREAPTPDIAKQEQQQYQQWWAAAEMQAYYNLLKERFKVQIKVPKPAADASALQ